LRIAARRNDTARLVGNPVFMVELGQESTVDEHVLSRGVSAITQKRHASIYDDTTCTDDVLCATS